MTPPINFWSNNQLVQRFVERFCWTTKLVERFLFNNADCSTNRSTNCSSLFEQFQLVQRFLFNNAELVQLIQISSTKLLNNQKLFEQPWTSWLLIKTCSTSKIVEQKVVQLVCWTTQIVQQIVEQIVQQIVESLNESFKTLNKSFN